MDRILRLHTYLAFALAFVFVFPTTATAQTATTTVLQVSPPCNIDGCVTTLTATVTAGGTPVHPGLVVFCDKGPADCQNEAPIGRAQLLADGTATIRLGLTPGPHSLRAVFHGTGKYGYSSSSAQSTSTPGSTFQRTISNGSAYATPKEGGYYFNTTYLSSNYLPAGGTLSYIDTSRGNAVLTSPPVVPDQQLPEFFYTTGDPQAVAQIPASLLTSAVYASAADFNNDGFQDVLLIDGNTVLSVLLGNGKGSFTLAPTSKTQTGAHGAMLVGDFNGDGKLDVAIPDAATGKIYIGLGDGTGNFTAAAPVTLTGSPQSLALCDLNNDGIPDLAAVSTVSGSGGEIEILLGQGDGTFTAQTPITRNGDVLASIAVADFNGDGRQDLVFFDQTAQSLTVLKGNGDGTFATAPAATIPFANGNSLYLATGDFDNNGFTDIYFSAQYGSTRFSGNGDFTFTGGSLITDIGPTFAFGDFVGDGALSQLAYQTSEDIEAIPDTAAIYSAPTQIVYSVQGVPPLLAVADFNGDGIPDVLVVNASLLQNPPGYGTPLTPVFYGYLSNTQTVPSVKTIFFDPGYHNIVDSYSGDAYHNPQTVPGPTVYSTGVDFYNGFTGSTGLTYNNAATLQGSSIQLAGTGQFQSASLFTTDRLDLNQQLNSTFDFQFPVGPADGFAYVLQTNGPDAIGSPGGGLGYGNPPGAVGPAITNSLAVAFDMHNNQGEGSNSIRLEYNGVTSPDGAIDLTPFKIDLHSGHRFHVVLTSAYLFGDGDGSISVSITDTVTKATTSQGFLVRKASLFSGNTAYVGFTAGTGTETAGPTIYDWTIGTQAGYLQIPPSTPYYSNGFTGATGLLFNGGSKLSGSTLQLTSGTTFEATSTYAARKVNALNANIDTDFDFTVGDGSGDGFTFVLQDHSPTAVGSTGGGLGYGVAYLGPAPFYAVVPNSLAVKFDLHNNLGEGPDSTGLYLNGASPTTPSVDLSSTGIDLHSGHTFHARIAIASGSNLLTLTITDLNVYKVFQTTFTLANPTVLQEGAVYAGFTAGTGGTAGVIQILNWTFTN